MLADKKSFMNKISMILIIIGSILILSSFIIFIQSKIPVECVQFQPCISGDPSIPIWIQPQFYVGVVLTTIGLIWYFKNK